VLWLPSFDTTLPTSPFRKKLVEKLFVGHCDHFRKDRYSASSYKDIVVKNGEIASQADNKKHIV